MNQRAVHATHGKNSINDPKNATRKLFADESKIQDQIHRMIVELQKKKKLLERKMQENKNKLKPKSEYPDRLTEILQGYSFSEFSHDVLDDGCNLYVAHCREGIHSFNVSVMLKDGRIIDTDFVLTPNSALQEIRTLLMILKEEKCPQLFLITIQQFIVLNNFRTKVIQKLMAATKIFQVVFPQYHEGCVGNSGVCTIIARKLNTREVLFELHWTMAWDEVHYMLLHCFNLPPEKGPCYPEIKIKLDDLTRLVFGPGYEDKLMTAWDSIIEVVKKVSLQ